MLACSVLVIEGLGFDVRCSVFDVRCVVCGACVLTLGVHIRVFMAW